ILKNENICVSVPVCRQVVGLGNPGMDGTRHSVGMAVLGALATRLGVADRWRGDKYVSGEVILSEVQQTHVVLLRPRMLMNVNGVSVAKAAAKFGIKPEDVLLVHDDLDKPLGKIAVKHGGSARRCSGCGSGSAGRRGRCPSRFWSGFWSRAWTCCSPSSPSRTPSSPPRQQGAGEWHRRGRRARPLRTLLLLLLRAERWSCCLFSEAKVTGRD
uniref:Peptidyl-tRNA hydrolase 1 homolog n=1 Tax=Stegastes partitus TaxID=144197 RepID=A0A3B4Z6V3_9TELE